MKLEMKRGFGKGHVLDRMEVDRYDNNVSQVAGDPELGGSDVSGSNEMLVCIFFGTFFKLKSYYSWLYVLNILLFVLNIYPHVLNI